MIAAGREGTTNRFDGDVTRRQFQNLIRSGKLAVSNFLISNLLCLTWFSVLGYIYMVDLVSICFDPTILFCRFYHILCL